MVFRQRDLQPGDQDHDHSNLASIGAFSVGENTVDLDINTMLEQPYYSTQNSTRTYLQSNIAEIAHPTVHNSLLEYEYGSSNATFDVAMSFRERHRFLDEVYNAHPDANGFSAKDLEQISQRAGLLMEEVLSWYEDEKVRRAKLLACCQHQTPQCSSLFPLSPASTTTPGPNSTVTLSMTQFIPIIPGTEVQTQQVPSTYMGVSSQCHPIPVRAKRGRPRKHRSPMDSESHSLESKRPKHLIQYPCPDCENCFPAERWSEHVKRVHFPDQIWECQKFDHRTRKICTSKQFFRSDNFGTHLKREHGCSELEIAQLKSTCKFRVTNFFHQICGICEANLLSRDESVEHIKSHFEEISQRREQPEDLGLSEWHEKCISDHKLKRGVHYFAIGNGSGEFSDESSDREDGTGPGQGSPNNYGNDHSNHQPDSSPNFEGDGGSSGDGSFYSSHASSFKDCRRGSTASSQDSKESIISDYEPSVCSTFGLEEFTLPFTTVRKLGRGSHGLVDEVMDTSSKETFARKSILHKFTGLTSTSQMTHLKNELSILKGLNHPHLVKLIGTYTDAEYSHIIMTPVGDQNLADFLRSSSPSQPSDLLRWIGCLSSAMDYLHDQQVQHLDVKPQNILVKGHNILLADFGTAKSFFNKDHKDVKSLALTPMYCAPETIFQGIQDYATDIFSLGCVFSEIITCYFGRPIREFESFRSKTGNKAFHLTISEAQNWIETLSRDAVQNSHNDQEPRCPAELLPKIMDMLAELPTNRPKAKELQAFFADLCQFRCSTCGGVEENGPSLETQKSEVSQSSPTVSDSARSFWENDFPLHPGVVYTPESYTITDKQIFMDAPSYNYPRPQECPSYFKPAAGPMYLDPPLSVSGKVLTNAIPTESPCFRPPSLSTSSDFSSGSSAMSSPYFNCSKATDVSELSRNGLGLTPEIIGFDDFAQEYGSRYSCMEQEFNYTDSLKPGFVDPSLIHPCSAPVTTLGSCMEPREYQSHSMGPPPHLLTPSHQSSHSSRPIKLSQSPYINYSQYPYPQRRPSLVSHQSYGSQDGSLDGDETHQKGRCPNPECGKVFKDLKAHMLTHQNERPEKCPITTCDYHIKGFARKYDKNRHTLTHYKGTMVCGFCPGSGSAAEKSFNRADVFKRHLTSVHAVEMTAPNSRKKILSSNNASKKLTGYASDATGKCSTCSEMFQNAQDFYEHLDDCVLRIVHNEVPSETNITSLLAEVKNDNAVHKTLRINNLPTTTINCLDSEDEDEEKEKINDEKNAESSACRSQWNVKSRGSSNSGVQKRTGLTHSNGGLILHTKAGRKKRKELPKSWGMSSAQMKIRKRIMCAFDGKRRLWKDDMMLSTDYEVRLPLTDGKHYVTDLDIQTLKRAESFHKATEEEKGPYHSDELSGMDLEHLMELKMNAS